MEAIVTFLGAHWVIFLVIAILLIFALIGYFVDSNSIDVDDGKTIKLGDEVKEPAKVEEVEVLSTVNETINNNQEVQTNEIKEETLDDVVPPSEVTTNNDTIVEQSGTQPLIQEDNNNVSTFEG